MKPSLTPKQEQFCHAYLETGNASEAYRKCYSASKMKPDTVNRKAKELLENGKITARVQELQDELKATSDIKKERILYELEAIMEAKITDYVELKNIKRNVLDEETNQLIEVTESALVFKDFDQLSQSQVRAVESIKQTKYGIELKLHGKSWTIERICKMLGYDATKKVDVTSGGETIVEKKVIILPDNGRDKESEKKDTPKPPENKPDEKKQKKKSKK